ncbi:MAG: glycoside hydrolase family 18 protein [Bacteroidales bacterium]|nr:glycoside hydrolase family 18 protein [Bacteroidales bacterium]
MKRIVLAIFALLLFLLVSCSGTREWEGLHPADKVMIAYVTSWSKHEVDPLYLTHINYAFAHVDSTFDRVRVDNPSRLESVVKLKKRYPYLKVLLSIGGWGSGNFSEMAADSSLRWAFAQDCRRCIEQYNLDGIDIDWEYPTTGMAKISYSENDTENYTKLMRDIRGAIGDDKLLTHATSATAKYIDHKSVDKYIDFTNVMAYDLGWAPYHNSPLYPTVHMETMCVDDAVKAHIQAGVPPEKLVMGLAFYGRGKKGFPRQRDLTQAHLAEGNYTFCWDSAGQVPYIVDESGELVFGYENETSLALKAEYIRKHNLKGAMYWSYSGDNAAGDLRRCVFKVLNRKSEREN